MAKVFIKTHGCQMNEYDSSKMVDILRASQGYELTELESEADLLLLNTCSIREKAQEKVFHQLGRWKKLKAANPNIKIGVGGCVASQEGAAISKRAPYVDVIFGPQTLHRLPELITSACNTNKTQLDISFPEIEKFDRLPSPSVDGPSAYVSIMEGCSKYCSFCVVPYTRGAEYSRPAESLLREATALVAAGAREITLLGQNVNAYHGAAPDGGTWSLARLIACLAEIDGLERLRYTTSHPRDMDDALIAAHRDIAQLMPYLHLPVQSGSDKVLKAMNRGHTIAHYLRLIERIRAARPDILISGDFIVGFPGESESDFADTMALVRSVNYGQAYSFKYSPRPGTPAAERAQVDEAVKSERLARLQALLKRQQQAAQDAMVGREVSVLFERPGRRAGQLVGKSGHLHAVHVAGARAEIGAIRRVRITGSEANSLAGSLVG